MRRSKRYQKLEKLLTVDKKYDMEETLDLIYKMKTSKFDETVEVTLKLGVDPKQADQYIRGSVALPSGTGKTVRIAVFAKGEKAQEARAAGADAVGDQDLVDKIAGGWFEFDLAMATPDMMGTVSKLGKVLGPKGLMPNPKTGTVTMDLAGGISEFKAGKIEYRVSKFADMNVPIGKISFEREALKKNLVAYMLAVLKARPASLKGTYIESMSMSLTQSPGIIMDVNKVSSQVSKLA